MKNDDLNEITRQAGIEAWGETLANMMADLQTTMGKKMDPAQIELVKQGIVQTFKRPKQHECEFPPEPKHDRIFRHEDEQGAITIYDWYALMQRATHCARLPNIKADGAYRDVLSVLIYDGNEIILKLHGPPAQAFWEWQEEMIELSKWRPSPCPNS